MKTTEQILARIKEVEPEDWFGCFERIDLAARLPYEAAKTTEYVSAEATAEKWAEMQAGLLSPLDTVKDYLPFAWDKANNCRGLSAGRSISHLRAWLWLAGYGKLVDEHFCEYNRYGKKLLVVASLLCGFDWKQHDNGDWVNDEGGTPLSKSSLEREIDSATQIASAAVREE